MNQSEVLDLRLESIRNDLVPGSADRLREVYTINTFGVKDFSQVLCSCFCIDRRNTIDLIS